MASEPNQAERLAVADAFLTKLSYLEDLMNRILNLTSNVRESQMSGALRTVNQIARACLNRAQTRAVNCPDELPAMAHADSGRGDLRREQANNVRA